MNRATAKNKISNALNDLIPQIIDILNQARCTNNLSKNKKPQGNAKRDIDLLIGNFSSNEITIKIDSDHDGWGIEATCKTDGTRYNREYDYVCLTCKGDDEIGTYDQRRSNIEQSEIDTAQRICEDIAVQIAELTAKRDQIVADLNL
jgi:hypothetical protein